MRVGCRSVLGGWVVRVGCRSVLGEEVGGCEGGL